MEERFPVFKVKKKSYSVATDGFAVTFSGLEFVSNCPRGYDIKCDIIWSKCYINTEILSFYRRFLLHEVM
jgi:hypothetical protein